MMKAIRGQCVQFTCTIKPAETRTYTLAILLSHFVHDLLHITIRSELAIQGYGATQKAP